MIAGMWMSRNLVTVEQDASITEAAMRMADHRIRRLPVVVQRRDGPHIVGIVSATDLYRTFPHNLNPFSVKIHDFPRSPVKVADAMTADPAVTSPETPIEEVARLMRDRKIGGLPVVRDGVLCGMITESDIFRAFVGVFEMPGGGVRVSFDTSEGEDIFGFLSRGAASRGIRVISLVSYHQEGRSVCVVRVAGGGIDGFLEDLWKSGHRVIHVLRLP